MRQSLDSYARQSLAHPESGGATKISEQERNRIYLEDNIYRKCGVEQLISSASTILS